MASCHADPATARAVAFSRRTRALFAGLAPLAVLLLPGALPAQSFLAPWQPRLPAVPGQNDPGLAGAYHAATGLTLIVGGNGAAAFDGRAVTAQQGPLPARTGAAMAYDRARQRTVLFGGAAAGSDLDDTWESDGTSWTQVAVAGPRPSARHGAVMVYDEWRQRCVLVGGFVNGLGQGDTWEWDGTTWTARALPPAGLRGDGAGAFDALRGHTILFGGSTTQGGPLRTDVWRYDGGGWLRLTPAVTPPPRVGAAMAYDRWGGRIVLFGGSDGTNPLGDTWLWNGRTWSQSTTAPAPAARFGAALVHDERRGELVLLGGSNSTGARGEVWRTPVDPRPVAIAYGTGCSGHSLAPVPGGPPALGATFALSLGGPSGLQLVSIGFSDVATAVGPLPLPLPGPGACSLWIDPAASVLFSPGPGGTFSLAIPAQPVLAGTEFHTQAFALAGGALTSSNGCTARIGTLQPGTVVPSPLDAASTDPEVSRLPGAVWIGGDGRHGPFDPSFGRDLGNGVFEFDTTATTIPGDRSPWSQPFTITDGNYYFDSLHVPAGVTVRFRGSVPARIHVRGTARIDGILDASGDAMTTFVAVTAVSGQPGGRGGPGGGTGGAGGDRCSGLGPILVGGVPVENGKAGQDVQVPVGHALAGSAAGTGGPGSPLYPASGLMSAIHYTINNVFGSDLAAGGGGGGYSGPGQGGAVQPQLNLFPGPPTAGGAAFTLPPVPGGTASIDWYLIGGAGGGGGASHPFAALITYPLTWRAGAGGSGGGGALALRCGRDLLVGTGGSIAARGGDGVTFSLWVDGYPSPGGGGSGGSLLLQSAGLLQNLGTLDADGGAGSRIDNVVPTTLQAVSVGGAGAPGRIRLESGQTPAPGATVPPLGSADIGPLLDQDVRTGLRSVWLRVAPPGGSSVLERYELDVVLNGVAVTFSDDPAVGMPAALGGPVVARFQGTQEDGGGGPDPLAVGPWRASFGSERRDDNCNLDVPQFVRIDLAFPTNPAPVIQQLRLYWH